MRRGASGHLPEHTLEAYAAAFYMGADMIEPDVVATRDHRLICFHDLYLEQVTDIEQRFPDRRRSDGHWNVIDFDLAELKSLAVTGRGASWSGMQIPTLDEMLALVARLNEQAGRSVGVIPELKKPAFHREEGIDIAAPTVAAIAEHGFHAEQVILQSFDADTLRQLAANEAIPYRLLYLMSERDKHPPLSDIARFADGASPARRIIERDPSFVRRAQDLGLLVISYTFEDEPAATATFFNAHGVDGIFTDYPLTAIEARGD